MVLKGLRQFGKAGLALGGLLAAAVAPAFAQHPPLAAVVPNALGRQIAESYGGALSLVNRDDRPGCRAIVRLPVAPPHQDEDPT